MLLYVTGEDNRLIDKGRLYKVLNARVTIFVAQVVLLRIIKRLDFSHCFSVRLS